MIRRIVLTGALGLLVAAAAGAIYVRTSPMDAAAWHVDPETAAPKGSLNEYLVGAGGDRPPVVTDLPPETLQARLDAALLAQPRTEILAATPETGLRTYVQRSRLMAYPDAITAKVTPEGAGSRLVIWSRSRFGVSDMGVNAARVENLLTTLNL
ncbi:DUF1499 domain-containing protein [Jannaschia seosinensis]|nr:DUF1499 domain-containing protein [Jannaschia seosinensis]